MFQFKNKITIKFTNKQNRSTGEGDGAYPVMQADGHQSGQADCCRVCQGGDPKGKLLSPRLTLRRDSKHYTA